MSKAGEGGRESGGGVTMDICSVSRTSTVQFAGHLLWARPLLPLGVNSKVASPAFRDLSSGAGTRRTGPRPQDPGSSPYISSTKRLLAPALHQVLGCRANTSVSVLKSMAGRGNRHGAVDVQ